MIITSFTGEYNFLSNNYVRPVTYNGLTFRCAASAYEAQKNLEKAKLFVELGPVEARQLGMSVKLREDWKEVREDIMYRILMNKFEDSEYMADKLKQLDGDILINGNRCHSNFWGVCSCPTCLFRDRKNMLGVLLMKVRDQIT